MKLMNLVLFNFTLMVVAMLPPFFCVGQVNNFYISENKEIKIISENNDLTSIRLCGWKNIRLYTSSVNTQKYRIFYIYNTDQKILSEIKIHQTKRNQNIISDRIYSLTLIGNDLIIVTNNYIFHLYVDYQKNQLELLNSLKNDQNFNFTKNLNGRIFLSVLYDFHPLDATKKHIWAIYNLTRKKLDNQIVMQDGDVKFSYFVNKWFDTFDDRIYFSESTKYSIGIYNEDFIKIDSIETNELDVNKIHLDKFASSSINSKQQINQLKIIDDSLLTRIRKIYVLSDTAIFVILKMKGTSKLRLDYWIKSNNKWMLCTQNEYSIWYEIGQEYSETNLETLSDFYQNMNDMFYAKDLHFELVYYPFMPIITTKSFDQKKDYYEIQNERLLHHKNSIGHKTIIINSCFINPQ